MPASAGESCTFLPKETTATSMGRKSTSREVSYLGPFSLSEVAHKAGEPEAQLCVLLR